MAFLPLSEWSLSKATDFKLVCDKKMLCNAKKPLRLEGFSVLILETRLKTLKSKLLKNTSNPLVERRHTLCLLMEVLLQAICIHCTRILEILKSTINYERSIGFFE